MTENLEAAKFIRLRGMVEAAANSIPSGQAVMAAHALAETYERARSEVRKALPDELLSEFDGLFPQSVGRYGAGARGDAERFNVAKANLFALGGWLSGHAESLRGE